MAKIVLMSGSPGKGGNSEQNLASCAQVISEEGLEAEIIFQAGIKIKSSTACGLVA